MAAPRVVVVVPRQETGLHDYLQRSLASVKDVEVVLDRRAGDRARASDERRRRSAANAERKILICSLVHCPAPAPPAEPPMTAAAVNGTHRTLLWPGLRLDDL
jgi:hypothetical protein